MAAGDVAIGPVGPGPGPVVDPDAARLPPPSVVRRSATPGDGIDPEIPVGPQHIYATQAGLQELRTAGYTGADPATKPSFWQHAFEILDFILSALPGIGQFINLFAAIVGIGRLAWAYLSGENREQIDWQKELARISGRLLGTVFPLAGALSNAMMNYWFDAWSDPRQGVQIFGGVNYFLGDDNFGRNKRGVVRETISYVRDGVSGMFTPTQPAVYDPATNPALITDPSLNGGPPQQGIQPRTGTRRFDTVAS